MHRPSDSIRSQEGVSEGARCRPDRLIDVAPMLRIHSTLHPPAGLADMSKEEGLGNSDESYHKVQNISSISVKISPAVVACPMISGVLTGIGMGMAAYGASARGTASYPRTGRYSLP